ILEGLNLSMDQFIDLCSLSGCDYCDSILGIGGQTALKLIHIKNRRIGLITYQEARQLFKEPAVLVDEQELDIKWSAPDEEAIEKIKAAKNKSSQGQLESFFKPVANTSVPLQRKEQYVAVEECKDSFVGEGREEEEDVRRRRRRGEEPPRKEPRDWEELREGLGGAARGTGGAAEKSRATPRKCRVDGVGKRRRRRRRRRRKGKGRENGEGEEGGECREKKLGREEEVME
ncbi:hypothetical protein Tsubulata_045345, partial [Turnera subulata]